MTQVVSIGLTTQLKTMTRMMKGVMARAMQRTMTKNVKVMWEKIKQERKRNKGSRMTKATTAIVQE